MGKARLANERWRPLYNRQMAVLRRLVSFVNDFPAHDDAPLFRLAIKEARVFIQHIKEDRRPVPPMPHIRRLGELYDTETDVQIMKWNDRQARTVGK